MTQDIELLPCPFCGGSSEIYEYEHCKGRGEIIYYYVRCIGDSCKVNPYVDADMWERVREAAPAHWNKRAAPETAAERDRLKAQVQMLTEALEDARSMFDEGVPEWEWEAIKQKIRNALSAVRGENG